MVMCSQRYAALRGAAGQALSRVVVLLFVLLLVTGEGDAQENNYRFWTSANGKYQTEAELLGVEDGIARLRKRNGDVINVPLDRLSQADQEHLQRMDAKEGPGDRFQDAAVVLKREVLRPGRGEPQVWTGPAVVALREGDYGYVLASVDLAFYRSSEDAIPEVRYQVAIGAGTEEPVLVDAELAGFNVRFGLAAWRVKAAGLPAPLPLNEDITIAQGTKVSVFGCQVTNPASQQLAVGRTVRQGIIETVVRDEHGNVKAIHIRGDNVGDLQLGIVVDDAGQVLGVTSVRPSSQRRSNVAPPVSAIPLSVLASLRVPQLRELSFAAQKWGEDGIHYQVSGKVDDLFSLSAKMELLVKRCEEESAFTSIAATDMAALPIDRPPLRSVISVSLDHLEVPIAVYHDAARIDVDRSPRYVAMLRSTDAAGTGFLSNRVEPRTDFTRQIDSQVRESLPGVRDARPHPGGGITITPPLAVTEHRAAESSPNTEAATPSFQSPQAKDSACGGPPYKLGTFQARAVFGLEEDDPRLRKLAGAEWSSDGKHVYLLHKNGILRKLTTPALHEVKRLSLPAPIEPERERFGMSSLREGGMRLMRSAEGLVAVSKTNHATREVWLIDEDTFQVKWRLPIYFAHAVVTAPNLSSLFLFGNTIRVVDLRAGRLIRGSEQTPGPVDPMLPVAEDVLGLECGIVATPDGRYVLVWNQGYLLRLRVDGSNLVFEEASERIACPVRSVFVTADSKTLVTEYCSRDADTTRRLGAARGVVSLDVTDFQAYGKSFELQDGKMVVAVDPAVGNIWVTTNRLSPCTTNMLSLDGAEVGRFLGGGEGAEYVLHPSGKLAMLDFGHGIAWIQRSEDAVPIRDADIVDPTPSPPADASGWFRSVPEWIQSEAPSPTAAKELIAGGSTTVGGMTLERLVIPELQGGKVHFSPNGDSLIAVASSWIRRIALPQLNETVQLDFRRTAGSWNIREVARSQAGIVLLVRARDRRRGSDEDSERPNVLIVNPDSLQIERALVVPDLLGLSVSHGSPMCLLMKGRTGYTEVLVVCDLVTGQAYDHTTRKELLDRTLQLIPTMEESLADSALSHLGSFVLCPDAEHAILVTQPLAHMTLRNGRPLLDKVGSLAPLQQTVRVDDLRYTAVGVKDFVATGQGEERYHIYRCEDISKPLFSVPNLGRLILDIERHRIYMASKETLYVYDDKGTKQGEHELPPELKGRLIRDVDPKTGRLLVEGHVGEMYLVTLPGMTESGRAALSGAPRDAEQVASLPVVSPQPRHLDAGHTSGAGPEARRTQPARYGLIDPPLTDHERFVLRCPRRTSAYLLDTVGVALSPDDVTLAMIDRDQKLCLFDCETGELRRQDSEVFTVSPDWTWQVCLSGGTTAVNLLTGERLRYETKSVSTGRPFYKSPNQFATSGIDAELCRISPDGNSYWVSMPKEDEGARKKAMFTMLGSTSSEIRFDRAGGFPAIAFSPDSAWVVLAGMGQRGTGPPSLEVLDVQTGETREQIDLDADAWRELFCVAVAPGGEEFAVVGSHGDWGGVPRTGPMLRIAAYSVVNRKWLWHVDRPLPGKHLFDLAYSPDGRFVHLQLWEKDIVNVILNALSGASELESDRFVASAFSPDGKVWAAGGEKETVLLLSTETWETVSTLPRPLDECMGVAFSRDGRKLALLCSSGSIQNKVRSAFVFDRDSNEPIVQATTFGRAVARVAFSHDGSRLFCAADDGTLRIFDLAGDKAPAVLGNPYCFATCLAVSGDDKRVVTGGKSGVAVLWDVADGRMLRAFESLNSLVRGVCVLDEQNMVVAAGQDEVVFWDANTGERKQSIRPHARGISVVAFAPGGAFWVSYGTGPVYGEYAAITYPNTKRQLAIAGTSDADDMALSPDCSLMAVASAHGEKVVLCDVEKGTVLHELPGHRNSAGGFAFSGDNRLLAIGSSTSGKKRGRYPIYVVDVKTGETVCEIELEKSAAASIALSSDGTLLAVGDHDSHVHLFRIPSGELVRSVTLEPALARTRLGVGIAGGASSLASEKRQ